MCVDVQIRAGGQVPHQFHLASVDTAPILIEELPLQRPSICLCPHIGSGSASQLEVLNPATERSPQLGLTVNGSPNTTTHPAQLASGFSHARDRHPDIAPAQVFFLPTVPPATKEVTAVPAAPMAAAASDELIAPKATDTSAELSVPAPDSYSDRGLENPLGSLMAVPTTATTYTTAAHPAQPPAKPQSFGIFIGWMGRHCTRRGCSVPAPKRPWTGRDAAAAKVVLDAPQETEETTHLAVSIGVEASTAPPAEITLNMGAIGEAPIEVARASK